MNFQNRLATIQKKIKAACASSQRDYKKVHLLAVSKKQSVEKIREAYTCGIRDFGENYLQELIQKKNELSNLPDIRWHLIGPVQTKKIKDMIGSVDFYHALYEQKTVDEIVKRINNQDSKKKISCFVQVNIDQENTKAGVVEEGLPDFLKSVRQVKEIELKGFMCIPSPDHNAQQTRAAFDRLARLADLHSTENQLELSMGMSSDFELAIEAGSNWVRVGTALFGSRDH